MEFSPLRWIPLTTAFGVVDTCQSRRTRWVCSRPWFSLFCYIAMKLGASEPASATVWILLETRMSQVTCMIQQRHLRLFGQVTRFTWSDLVSRVISESCDQSSRGRPRGRPHGCRELMVTAGSWYWQERRMHGTPLAETNNVGAKPWPPPTRHLSACSH